MLAVGLCAVILTPIYFEPKDPSKCTKLDSFRKLQTYAESARNSICYSCNCYFPNSDNFKEYSPEELVQINTVDAPLLSRTDSSYAVKVQDCPGWNSTDLSKGYGAFQEMEVELECSGWCENTSSLFYRFTDVNKGTHCRYLREAQRSLLQKAIRIGPALHANRSSAGLPHERPVSYCVRGRAFFHVREEGVPAAWRRWIEHRSPNDEHQQSELPADIHAVFFS